MIHALVEAYWRNQDWRALHSTLVDATPQEHATDEEIVEGMLLLARTEGIFTETAGGVTVAALKKLVEQGLIPRNESVVLSITGIGLKTPDVLNARLDVHAKIRPSLSAFDQALADLKRLPRTT